MPSIYCVCPSRKIQGRENKVLGNVKTFFKVFISGFRVLFSHQKCSSSSAWLDQWTRSVLLILKDYSVSPNSAGYVQQNQGP